MLLSGVGGSGRVGSGGEEPSKCMNIKRTLFLLWLFCLPEAQTEIPPPLPVKSLTHQPDLPPSSSEGVLRKKGAAAVPKGRGRTEGKDWAQSGESAGSQLGRSVCSVLCTSSGTSFGLLFLHDLVNYVYMNDDQLV